MGKFKKEGGGDGKMERKPRNERFGNRISQPDTIRKGKYVPWARSQQPGSVKEVAFNAESRKSYLTGFRKRKTERSKVAKKGIERKLLNERKKERNEKHRELMEAYDARQKKMKEMAHEVEVRDSDDDESGDSDEGESEVDDREEPEHSTLRFYDGQSGSATTVEVQEMNLDDIHSVSVASSTLPALPPPEPKLGKKARQLGKGRARIKRKELQPKSKRDRHMGGRKKKK